MSKLVLNSFMDTQDMLLVIRKQTRRPRLASIRLEHLHLDKTVGQALLQLLHLHRHRSYDTLELCDCAETPYLAELLRYVYHAQLFRHVSMQAEPTVPSVMRTVRVAPPTSRFHFALQTLSLSHLYVSIRNAVRLRKGLEATKQLSTLNLDCVQFERCAICQISQGVESNTTLQTLYCHWISSVDAYVMMHSVQAHPTLKDIHFCGDCISDSGSVFLGKGLNEPDCQLQTLRLTGLGVFDLAPMISEIRYRPSLSPPSPPEVLCRLKRLDLSDNLLQNYQVDYLFSCLYKFPVLKELNLSRNRLSDFCDAILADPNILSQSLISLDLTYNRLTDQGADELLTHLWKFPTLRDLNLSRNRLQNLEFPNFLRARPVQTHSLRRLSLFHPHFSLLDPGEAVFHLGWMNTGAGVAMTGGAGGGGRRRRSDASLLRLLKRTPNHLKIGSFWACKSIETQYLLDIRQVSVAEDPASVSVALWPHMMAQANQLFCNDESRRANAVFYLVHQGAPYFMASRQRSRRLDAAPSPPSSDGESVEEFACLAQDVALNNDPPTANDKPGQDNPAQKSNKKNRRQLSPLERDILEGRKEASSEFLTCSMQESESTEQSNPTTGHTGIGATRRGQNRRYRRLLRIFRMGSR